jgi:two-component system LytT family response regulator
MNPRYSIQRWSKSIWGMLGLTLLVLSLGLGQDYIHSNLRQYGFELSESLLFNSFWVFFIPFSLFQIRLNRIEINTRHIKSTKLVLIVIISTLLHLVLFSFFVFTISTITLDHTYGFSRMLSFSLSEKLFITLIIYTAVFLIVSRLNLSKIDSKNPEKIFVKNVSVNTGSQTVLLKTEEIISISAFSPYIKLSTANGEFIYSQSLKSFLEKLDPTNFIRIHKSTIVNLNEVISYKSRQNGDYDIRLSNGNQVRLSRNYSAHFKANVH